MQNTAHWTAKSTDAFIHRITFDFITQLVKKLESIPMSQVELAQILNVSEGAVSQVLNTPRNPTLRTAVNYARALGLKVALVAYDDRDPDNKRGPINSEIFNICWERANRPVDFFSLKTNETESARRALSREYMTVEGLYARISPKSAENSPSVPISDFGRLFSPDENQSTVGKATVQHKEKTLLRLVS